MTIAGTEDVRGVAQETPGRFAPQHPWDRNFFLLILAGVWGGIIAGFVQDALEHFSGKHVAYAPIVHLHAALYVGWLVLLTTQMTLIRAGRADLHRRLGLAGFALIPLMALVGPLTSLTMDRLEIGTPDDDPAFLAIPLLGALSFAVIALSGLALRRNPAAHKRLMLLAVVFISDAGFARWLAGPLTKVFGAGVLPFYVESYFGPALLVSAMVIYDLVTRKRLHPAFMAAAAFGVTNEVIACTLYNLPAWKPIAQGLIGHP